ncbi:hypothetical protein JTB14_020903 [Gonioctena quinquepunctata]|nr:hypothetical protein JTB14_020903 [Gonioctena quinquepunctata]
MDWETGSSQKIQFTSYIIKEAEMNKTEEHVTETQPITEENPAVIQRKRSTEFSSQLHVKERLKEIQEEIEMNAGELTDLKLNHMEAKCHKTPQSLARAQERKEAPAKLGTPSTSKQADNIVISNKFHSIADKKNPEENMEIDTPEEHSGQIAERV